MRLGPEGERQVATARSLRRVTLRIIGCSVLALAGWWWADPVAALGMVPIIATEGLEDLRGEAHGDDCR